MRRLLTIVCVLISVSLNASPIRSAAGQRHLVMTTGEGHESYSAKDYVQDGLVSMWDGIENAGWGIHNPNARTWVDLINNLPMSIGSYNWEFNCWVPSANTYGYVSQLLSLACLGGEYTLEMVYAPQDDSTVSYGSMIYATDASSVKLLFLADRYTDAKHSCFGYRRTSGNVNRILGELDGGASLGVVHAGNFMNFYYKGSYVSNISDVTVGMLTASTFWVNRGYFGYGKGKYYNIRLYSRALTVDEIAANYAIDKERFNLP